MPAGGDAERFPIGAKVVGADGTCGELTGVIIDPVARVLTHLVVTPRHHHGFGRLAPLDLVESDGDPIRLNCTVAQFRGLDEGEENHFLPAADETSSYAGGQAYNWPRFELGPVGGRTESGLGAPGFGHRGKREEIASDRVPVGEVDVHRGDPVHASDGFIGAVEGLIVDPTDHHVTHVLLGEGHFWGRKQVAIPIGAMTSRDQEIRVELTKEQIGALPPVDLKSVT
jgi:PRC-barrel domain